MYAHFIKQEQYGELCYHQLNFHLFSFTFKLHTRFPFIHLFMHSIHSSLSLVRSHFWLLLLLTLTHSFIISRPLTLHLPVWSISTINALNKSKTNKSYFHTIYQKNLILYALKFFCHKTSTHPPTLFHAPHFQTFIFIFLILFSTLLSYDSNVQHEKLLPLDGGKRRRKSWGLREKREISTTSTEKWESNNNKTKNRTNSQVFTQLWFLLGNGKFRLDIRCFNTLVFICGNSSSLFVFVTLFLEIFYLISLEILNCSL